jgi:hypothetical protein
MAFGGELMLEQIHLGDQRLATSRYVSYKVSGDRNRMLVKFKDPEQSVRVEGADNVAAALLEIDAVFAPDERGWERIG